VTSLTDFYVHPISEPRPYPLDYLRDNELYPILINGIVNPNGPTLAVVAAVRDRTSAPLALVYAYLNPFRSELLVPGYFREGQLAAHLPDQILQALRSLEIFSGGVPTLCIPAGYIDVLDVRYLYSHLFANDESVRQVYERLQRFPLNPWDRVSEEMQEAFGSLTENQVGQSNSLDDPMDDEEMNALLDIVLDPEHNKCELPAFAYAWKGAIDQQRSFNNDELADSALQYDDFVPFLVHILDSAGYQPE